MHEIRFQSKHKYYPIDNSSLFYVQVNGTEMTGKSQGEAVNILRSTRGLVKLLIQREEIIQAPIKPAVEVKQTIKVTLTSHST